MIKKILISIACFMLVIGCVFTPLTAHASTGQTYTYDDSEVYSDTSNLGNYAIQDIESLTVNGGVVFKATISISASNSSNLVFLFGTTVGNGDFRYTGNFFYSNFNFTYPMQMDCNFAIRCTTSTDGVVFAAYNDRFGTINGQNVYKRYLGLAKGNTFEIYFSNLTLGGTFDNLLFSVNSEWDNLKNYVFNSSDYDLSVFNDMNSETNFSYSNVFYELTFIRSYPFFSRNLFRFSDISLGLAGYPSFSYTASDLASYLPGVCNGYIMKGSSQVAPVTTLQYFLGSENSVSFDYNLPMDFSYNLLYRDFYFSVLRPVYRTNNTLIVYNYDYDNLLYNVSSVTYQLQKGNDRYNVVYNGSLPNSTFIYVSNNRINNILFDNYIYVYFTFQGSVLSYNFIPFGSLTTDTYDMGFDFNFTYYNEPLVSSNGSYNFDFDKPGYVDMRFSLVPFYIPVLEAVQNALIFLIFYCPLISDILELIHLDQFFGAIFNLFGFENGGITLLGINLGGFIWACIAFLIFFKVLRSFMPILWGSGKAVVSDVVARSNRLGEEAFYNANRYEAEKKKGLRDFNYTLYKDKQIGKNIMKSEKKYFRKK